MVLMLRLQVLCCLLVALLFSLPPAYADAPKDAVSQQAPDLTPGLSELGPRVSKLTDFVEKSEGRLKALIQLEEVQSEFLLLSKQQQDLRHTLTPLGNPSDWYIDRLTQFNNQYLQLKIKLEALQQKMTDRQKEIEQISLRSKQETEFWTTWEKELRSKDISVPKKTVSQVRQLLKRLNKSIDIASASILKVQEQTSTLQQEIISELDLFAEALAQLRKATFRKNAHSLISVAFWQQFDSALLNEGRQGLNAALVFDLQYLQRYLWLVGLMLGGIALLTFAIRRYSDPLQELEDWNFVLRHPFAASSFVMTLLGTNLFVAPPAQLHYLLMVIGVISGAFIAVEIVENRRQVFALVLAATILVVTSGLRLIDLPQPFFRLYIVSLSLITLPVLIGMINSSQASRGQKNGRLFRALLRIAIAVMLTGLAGQAFGFMNFSTWILQAAFETGMVLLFAHMFFRLGSGLIEFLLHRPLLKNRTFIKRFGKDLGQRFENLIKGLVILYCLFYLMPLWRLFSTSRETWEVLSQISYQVGTVQISVKMLALATLSFYLAMQISWLVQGLVDTRIFYRKSVDRGVRDSIKKLIHYGIVTIGFLTVLSLLGMSLQNFVVILGAFGVGIGFGLQDIVNNFLSGLILLFERPVKVGDFIVVNEEWGTISKIGLRSTVVETINHSEIIVPNSQLISEKVTNWTFSSRIARLVIPVGVAYGSNVELVMRILTEVATGHPDAVHEPAPSILFIEFGDSSLNFEIRVFVQDISARFRIRSEMLQQIDARFREAGVEIPFPQRDLHLRSVDGQILKKMDPSRTEP